MLNIDLLLIKQNQRDPGTNLMALNPWLVVWLLIVYFQQVCGPSEFMYDILTPYDESYHGSKRTAREIAECQHVQWQNRTFEEFKIPTSKATTDDLRYNMHRFVDTVQMDEDISRKKYLMGTIAILNNPAYTMSVLEPSRIGGCKMNYYSAARSTVSETAKNRAYGCKVALNAGYFSVTNGQCYGNVVSDGNIVQTANNEQNANFGIRSDGTIVVGYITDKDIVNSSLPFRQLVSGVIWLVRNGTNYVNESMFLECSSHEDTGGMETFVNVLSARTAVGHDQHGRIIVAQVEGQTHRRGANLYEFAEVLLKHGVVNAINLDGGGSSTFLHDNVLINYPSDHCPGQPEYRCQRPVSSILCFHNVQCLEPNCSGHGLCDHGQCSCYDPWIGEHCSVLNCSLTECNNHGNCSEGVCHCDSGWTGPFCNQTCPSNYYGPDCTSHCWCYGYSYCDSISGECKCEPGYQPPGCWKECTSGSYGQDCDQRCSCSGNSTCNSVNGSCVCEPGWTGAQCEYMLGSGGYPEPIPAGLTPQYSNISYKSGSSSDAVQQTHAGLTPQYSNSSSMSRSASDAVQQTLHLSSSLSRSHVCAAQNVSLNSTYKVLMLAGVLVAVGSVLVHVLVCLVVLKCRSQTFRAMLHRAHSKQASKTPTYQGKKKRLRKRRPKFVPLVQDTSSSDCSI